MCLVGSLAVHFSKQAISTSLSTASSGGGSRRRRIVRGDALPRRLSRWFSAVVLFAKTREFCNGDDVARKQIALASRGFLSFVDKTPSGLVASRSLAGQFHLLSP